MTNLAFFTGAPGPFEILLILIVVLLLFGAKRLPDLARAMGKSMSEFKKGKEEGARDSGDEPAKIEESPNAAEKPAENQDS